MFFLLKPDAFESDREKLIVGIVKEHFDIVDDFHVCLNSQDVQDFYRKPKAVKRALSAGFTSRPLRVLVLKPQEDVFRKSKWLKLHIRKTFLKNYYLNYVPFLKVGGLVHSPDSHEYEHQISLLRTKSRVVSESDLGMVLS